MNRFAMVILVVLASAFGSAGCTSKYFTSRAQDPEHSFRIVISSVPAGAEVLDRNGTVIGMTPLTLSLPSIGRGLTSPVDDMFAPAEASRRLWIVDGAHSGVSVEASRLLRVGAYASGERPEIIMEYSLRKDGYGTLTVSEVIGTANPHDPPYRLDTSDLGGQRRVLNSTLLQTDPSAPRR